MKKRVLNVVVPVEISSDPQTGTAEEVFACGYEAGFFGEGLSVLDIGANIGAFAIWANLRWPGSSIRCYEPHPGTFQVLQNNVAALKNVSCINAAVYPREVSLYARYAGDGEATVSEHVNRLFDHSVNREQFAVASIPPAEISPADVVKVDTEGSEIEIFRNLDLSGTSLVMTEYHTMNDREELCSILREFSIATEHRYPYNSVPQSSGYRTELRGDYFGVLVLARPGAHKVWKREIPPLPNPGLRRLLRYFPEALSASVAAFFRRR